MNQSEYCLFYILSICNKEITRRICSNTIIFIMPNYIENNISKFSSWFKTNSNVFGSIQSSLSTNITNSPKALFNARFLALLTPSFFYEILEFDYHFFIHVANFPEASLLPSSTSNNSKSV